MIRVEVPSDLMLNAAMVGELDDGATATTRRGPSDDACMADVTASHGFCEDARESREECSFSVAGKTSVVPIATAAADHLLQLLVKMLTVAGILKGVDVGNLLRAMVWRVHDERATCTATVGEGFPRAPIIEVNVFRVDAFNASPDPKPQPQTLSPPHVQPPPSSASSASVLSGASSGSAALRSCKALRLQASLSRHSSSPSRSSGEIPAAFNDKVMKASAGSFEIMAQVEALFARW
eukprot:CAMPEP_0197636706 /NCGR_PEP_ID=MMETSP1338-20131121/12126_1 /TAXON_ID=43686 ORGANISM="Pelagodinium beii, Strain RCC1491" /NCGR_SAMPLE_ID=MMETSP1338 /ASSEMBLY_ACC=CAM_ASM_000754 /LENGTH=236 /DNA_ID=CAMNT_0043208981 /DNA_START=47 /DNA_END=755 /DNA_ORIENTATION=+